jgi:hypothetical protein
MYFTPVTRVHVDHGQRFPERALQAEFLRCKQANDLSLDGTSEVIRELGN